MHVWASKMMIHIAQAALRWGRNARFHHTFREEDGMCWLKRFKAEIAKRSFSHEVIESRSGCRN